MPDVIVPASFNFPHTGKLLSLSFVLFAGWFADASARRHGLPARWPAPGCWRCSATSTSPSRSCSTCSAIPADTFQLFLATGVVNARFGTLLSAVHTLVMALLGTCAVIGVLGSIAASCVRFCVITAVLTVVVVGGTRLLFAVALKTEYDKDKVLAGMQALRNAVAGHGVQARGPGAAAAGRSIGSVLDRVQTSEDPARRLFRRQPALRRSSTRAAISSASTWRWRSSSRAI